MRSHRSISLNRALMAAGLVDFVRIGGTSLIVMRSRENKAFPDHGVYLEVVKNSRLVFTDAFTKAG